METTQITLPGIPISDDSRDEITEYAARALFASAWADYQEDGPGTVNTSGCEILDIMPDTLPPEAIQAARKLVRDTVAANPTYPNITNILLAAQALPDRYADRPCNEEHLGHYLAMEAMGTGVGLESVCDRDTLDLNTPYISWTWYDLDPGDYPDHETDPTEQR